MLEIKVMASGSKGNCYLVGDGKSRLLLEAGIPLPKIQKGCGYELNRLAGCLVTHIHKDHSLSVSQLSRRGIKVYGTEEMLQAGLPVRSVRGEAEQKMPFAVGTFTVRAFEAVHDCECYGYYLRSIVTGDRLVYLTDSAEVPYSFGGIDYWLMEANYSLDILDRNVAAGMDSERANRVIATHMSIEKLETYFKGYASIPAREIYLLHLSEDNSDEEEFKRRIEAATGVPVVAAR